MKRIGSLFPELCSFGHLLAAFHRAFRGSGNSPDALRFYFRLEPELLRLQQALREGTYQPAPYRYFQIYDPKARTIAVAPFVDRVVHHAVVALLEPIYERCFIFDSYATRKGKGTHAAILRAQHFLRRHRWYFKTDIHQFFDSIDHDTLLELIHRKVKDRAFLQLTERIIRNGGQHGKGLPIGNLTSQFFANVYLNPLDHWVKQELRARAYVRYMDDFVLFAQAKDTLQAHRTRIEAFLAERLHLHLKPGASHLNQPIHGLSFLGGRIFPHLIRIHPVNLRRSWRKLMVLHCAWQGGEISEADYSSRLASHWAYLSWFDSHQLRQKLVRDL